MSYTKPANNIVNAMKGIIDNVNSNFEEINTRMIDQRQFFALLNVLHSDGLISNFEYHFIKNVNN